MNKTINILGIEYTVTEVEVVNKEEPRKGEINYLADEIRLDKTMPDDLKEQVLYHEVLHAIFDLLGLDELNEDEGLVQRLATAIYQTFELKAASSS